MGRLVAFIFVVVFGITFMLPGHSPGRSGNPHRVTTPSEPARDTELERSPSGHFYTHAKVNGELVRFIVDTGADVVALTRDDAERVGLAVDPSRFEVIGEGASGPVRGARVKIDSIEVDGKLVNDVDGIVLADSSLSLLGQSYLSRISTVQMSGDYMVLR
ncbi:MAG TPA: TIGR02281 family clan AA aspartic protease [Sphingomicrobium sp.]